MKFRITTGGVYLAPNCTVVGDVKIGDQSSVWFGTTIRGDVAPIRIGRRVNLQDHVVVHCDSGVENEIEDDVTIGHSAVIHGTHIGAGSLIGMGATLLGQTRIGHGCLVAAGAVLSPGMELPDGMVAMGVPAKIIRPVRPKEYEYMRWLTTHYVELAQKYAAGEVNSFDEQT